MTPFRDVLLIRTPEATREQLHKRGIWVCGDGSRIFVTNMQTSHIENTLNMLRRKSIADCARHVSFYASTPAPKGEMAQYMFDIECEYAFNELTPEEIFDGYVIVPFLKKELENRP